MLRHSGNQVVACEEVTEYRDAVLALVGREDVVLEVGSHVGGTTKVIASVAGRVVGLDQQPELVAQARERYPEIRFEARGAPKVTRFVAELRCLRLREARGLEQVHPAREIYQGVSQPRTSWTPLVLEETCHVEPKKVPNIDVYRGSYGLITI